MKMAEVAKWVGVVLFVVACIVASAWLWVAMVRMAAE